MIVECPPIPTVRPPCPRNESRGTPSQYLVDTHYLSLTKKNIRGTFNIEISSVTEEKKISVDKLGRILHHRLAKHIRTKVNDPSNHNHPALLFVKADLNQFTALLYFFEQAKYSRVLNHKSSILEDPSKGGFVAATDDELEGSYLHYFNDGCKFVRSGKAVGSDNSCPVSGIVQRNDAAFFLCPPSFR